MYRVRSTTLFSVGIFTSYHASIHSHAFARNLSEPHSDDFDILFMLLGKPKIFSVFLWETTDRSMSTVHRSVLPPANWSKLHLRSYDASAFVLCSAWVPEEPLFFLDLLRGGDAMSTNGSWNRCSNLSAASHLVWLGECKSRNTCGRCAESVRQFFPQTEVYSWYNVRICNFDTQIRHRKLQHQGDL